MEEYSPNNREEEEYSPNNGEEEGVESMYDSNEGIYGYHIDESLIPNIDGGHAEHNSDEVEDHNEPKNPRWRFRNRLGVILEAPDIPPRH